MVRWRAGTVELEASNRQSGDAKYKDPLSKSYQVQIEGLTENTESEGDWEEWQPNNQVNQAPVTGG